MRRQATAVIGASFGDEGKGLIVDRLAREGGGGLVVRFNCGAQAGHTVVLASGERHVFGHLGSGSLARSATFLSRYFVVNPILYLRERSLVSRIAPGLLPTVFVDPEAELTTPYDMLVNQAIEAARGARRHGSCGVGFGETIERGLRPRFRTVAGDVRNRDELALKLRDIAASWVPERLAALGLEKIPADVAALLGNEDLLERFLDEASLFASDVEFAGSEIMCGARRLIFEGAQGLLLDAEHPWFPHVTRSKTGLRNAAALARQAGLGRLEVVYATRSYLTRHGAGPLPFELPGPPYPGIVDPTNFENPFQGRLRFAPLNLDLLARWIGADLGEGRDLALAPSLALTCLDQAPPSFRCVIDGSERDVDLELFRRLSTERIGLPLRWLSRGPTAADLQEGTRCEWPSRSPVRIL